MSRVKRWNRFASFMLGYAVKYALILVLILVLIGFLMSWIYGSWSSMPILLTIAFVVFGAAVVNFLVSDVFLEIQASRKRHRDFLADMDDLRGQYVYDLESDRNENRGGK